jgi:hypothetical protein
MAQWRRGREGGGGVVGNRRWEMRHRWVGPGREGCWAELGCWAKSLFRAKMREKKENGLENRILNLFKD